MKGLKPKAIEYYVNPDGCHICTSHGASKGYPFISLNGKKIAMSRYVYIKTWGDIPTGLLIRHTCDNRGCINPAHLLLGTYADNSRDMTERNRQAKGSKINTAKLTRTDVEQILKYPHTVSNAEIAKKYNVNALNISRIRNGVIWKSVPRPLDYKYIPGNNGETNGSAKLTEDDVRAIRGTTGITRVQLSKRYGVCPGIISEIILRKTWKHVL